VPDLFVFMQYAVKDNSIRIIDINSIISNNFLFDLLIYFGDNLGFDYYTDWLILIISLTLFFIVIKYTMLLSTGRFFGVLIVYISSFFIDLNQLRFNFGMLLIILSYSIANKYLNYIFKFFSFFCHLMPTVFEIIRNLFFNKRARGLLLLSFIVLLPTGFLFLFSQSRILELLYQNPSKYPKVLILFFPCVYYLKNVQIKSQFFINIKQFSFTLLTIGTLLFFINFEVSARLFEVAFTLVCILNVYFKKSNIFDLFLLILSISVLVSRLISGINTGSDFIEIYQ